MKNSIGSRKVYYCSRVWFEGIGLDNGEIHFTRGPNHPGTTIATDNLFHHYLLPIKQQVNGRFIYKICWCNWNRICHLMNNNPLVIGGNTFIGNMLITLME
jgi:hypothetical protein